MLMVSTNSSNKSERLKPSIRSKVDLIALMGGFVMINSQL